MSMSVGKIGQGIGAQPIDIRRVEKALDVGFKSLVVPSIFLSATSSIYSAVSTNLFGKENDFVDKVASAANRAAYFFNGIYGGVDSAFAKNVSGAVGYSLVALSSLMGNDELLYFLKGPGSAFDQLPSMLEDVAFNPRVIEKYKTKGREKDFNRYSSLTDSFKKTCDAIRIVCSDIVREFKQNSSKGILKNIVDVIIKEGEVGKDKDNETAERNLVISSTGIMTGVLIGALSRFKGLGFKIGSSIRDLSGIHADLSLFKKAFSKSKGKATGLGNIKYGVSGALYTVGSLVDLVYRWTGIPKLNLAAVGFDNAGFLFMTWASATDHKASREKSRSQPHRPEPIPVLPETKPTLSPATC